MASIIGQLAGKWSLRTVVATVAQCQAAVAVNDAITQATKSYQAMLGRVLLV